jgi:hypothetical protein
MKPYAVEISFTMIVMAEDEDDAIEAAEDFADDAWRDDASKDFNVYGPVRTEGELAKHGWDGECPPYNGDGETRLKDILASMEPEPQRDTRTIDMFTPQAS